MSTIYLILLLFIFATNLNTIFVFSRSTGNEPEIFNCTVYFIDYFNINIYLKYIWTICNQFVLAKSATEYLENNINCLCRYILY